MGSSSQINRMILIYLDHNYILLIVDDMGMGKTLQAISLLLKSREKEKEKEKDTGNENNTTLSSTDDKGNKKKNTKEKEGEAISNNEDGYCNSTLVICPLVALSQWQTEIEKYTKSNTLSVLIYHGSQRASSVLELTKNDVILTSYSVLETEYRYEKKGYKRNGQIIKRPSLLHAVKWKRVIIDEAHSIKTRSSSTGNNTFPFSSLPVLFSSLLFLYF